MAAPQPHVAPGVVVRKARLGDVGAMHRIVNEYAAEQLMLAKTHLQLYENLRDFSVAALPATDDEVLGCGALHLYWADLAEIRAVAVRPGLGRRGVGTAIVEALIAEAQALGLEQAFVFTYVADFFRRFGFVPVEPRSLPLKVYNECFQCPKFHKCDETAMILHL